MEKENDLDNITIDLGKYGYPDIEFISELEGKFVGRVKEQEAFWHKYDALKDSIQSGKSSDHVLYYYGINGIGKTKLLNTIEKKLNRIELSDDQEGRCIRLNLKDSSNTRSIIIDIKNNLKKKYKFKFPITEFTLNKFYKDTGTNSIFNDPDLSSKIHDNQLNKIFEEIFSDFLPGSGVIKTCIGLIKWIESRLDINLLDEFKKIALTKESKEILRRANIIPPAEFEQYFHKFLIFDLKLNLANLKTPMVVMIDSYERYINIFEGDERVAVNKDIWLRQIIKSTPEVLWVIAGRDELGSRRSELPYSWSSLGVDQIRLNDFSNEESKEFLMLAGITDDNLLNHLVRISKGVPLSLAYCRDIYLSLAADKTKQIDISNYDENMELLIGRFVNQMDNSMIEAIKIFACFEDGWTDKMINSIYKKRYSLIIKYQKIKMLSCVTKSESSSRYEMHSLVRAVILGDDYSDLKNGVNSYQVDYYIKEIKKHTNIDESIDDYFLLIKASLRCDRCESVFNEVIFNWLERLQENYYFEIVDEIINLYREWLTNNISYKLLNTKINRLRGGLYSRKGEYDKAIEIYEDLYKQNIIDNGRLDSETFLVFNSLSNTYLRKGYVKKALSSLEECFRIASENKYVDFAVVLEIMNSLATAYQVNCKLELAWHYSILCYDNRRKLFGDNNKKTLETKASIASVYMSLGKAREAINLLEECYNQSRIINGEYSIETHGILFNLGTAYVNSKDENAKSILESIYLTFKNKLGELHPVTLDCYSNLIQVIKKVDLPKAIEMQHNHYEQVKSIYSEDNISIAKSLLNLSTLYGDLGDKSEEAVPFYEKELLYGEMSRDISIRIHGSEDNLDAINALENIAIANFKLGKHTEGLNLNKRCYELMSELLGEDNPQTRRVFYNIEAEKKKAGIS